MTASYESWRQTDLDLPNSPARPRFACLGWDGYPGKVTRFHDEVKHLGDTVFSSTATAMTSCSSTTRCASRGWSR